MVNKAILIGRLGADPETRYSQSGNPCSNFRIATTDFYKKNGTSQKNTEWHRIVAFGKLATICRDHLKTGRQVYIEGRIQYREWTDREGKKRYTTEIVANVMRLLGSKPQNGDNQPQLNSDDGPQLSSEEE